MLSIIFHSLLLLVSSPSYVDAFSSQPLETIKKRTVTSTKTIRIGTRPSPLAKIQANQVASKLERLSENGNIHVEIIDITATGDEENTKHFQQESKIDAPLAIQSVDFTSTLDDALLRNKIDVAVHSCKDIPPANRWCKEDGKNLLTIASVLEREIPCDVLIYREEDWDVSWNDEMSIASLPYGSRVGTSAIRRQAQLLHLRSDLELVNLRGNVGSRLEALKKGEVDELILAYAGLKRLWESSVDSKIATELSSLHGGNVPNEPTLMYSPISFDDILSGCCQGVVATVCRSADSDTLGLLKQIDCLPSSIAVAAERSFLNELDTFHPQTYKHKMKWKGRPPLAAYMSSSTDASKEESITAWTFQGLLTRPDGSKLVNTSRTYENEGIMPLERAEEIGLIHAKELLSKAGADFYLDDNED